MNQNFDCTDITYTMDLDDMFEDAITVSNGIVIFTPKNADCIGTFDASTLTFSCIDISDQISGDDKFSSATCARYCNKVSAPPCENPLAKRGCGHVSPRARNRCGHTLSKCPPSARPEHRGGTNREIYGTA